jgi:TonB family protein
MNMSCTDVAAVLDSHRMTRLAPAERAQVDAHLAACADCTAAWHAQTELAALRVPNMPATLLERALLASRLPQSAPARRARLSIVVGSVVLAGMAAAAATYVSLTRQALVSPHSSAVEAPATPTSPDTTLAAAEPQAEAALASTLADEDTPTSVELVEVALGVQPVVRANPTYPPQALKDGLGGHVQLKFDVTAAGTVENVSVVESSDPQFEPHAVQAVAEWRYLPRIVAGKRVGSKGIHTVLRFALEGDRTPAPPPPSEEQLAAQRQWLAFYADLEIAMDRLAADDLRSVELQLDEMQALYGAERAELWNFYGYLYTVQGNYGRAIDAYERSVAIYEPTSNPASGPWVPLANLYFARHQYDIALKTLLRPQRAANRNLDPRATRLGNEGQLLLERLRALGVTEETL